MPKLTFIDYEGVERAVSAEVGLTLMEVARNNDIPGIAAECGGMCACATCHVFIDKNFLERVGPVTEAEEPMLEFVDDAGPNSRLSCQIEVTEDLDGMRVVTPESQG